MTERDVIRKTKEPLTLPRAIAAFQELGLEPGMTVLLHSSLSALGWVCGGAQTIILALQEVLRGYGTLLMPTHSADLSDPQYWSAPAVPRSWWTEIRETMPPYDPQMTPTRGMGRIPELFRTQPNVYRSIHPAYSFAAWGEQALELVDGHELDYGLGEKSPLARIYEAGGWVLLLGVGHDSNTTLHLAEYRGDYPRKRTVTGHAPVRVDGHRRWKSYEDIDLDSSDFPRIGREFERRYAKEIRRGRVGLATARLFPQPLCVDWATEWMRRRRR
jgi:aminoglycoside 3-N-acetyltransferase